MIETSPEDETAEPVHVLPSHDDGGVGAFARQVAEASGRRLVRDRLGVLDRLAASRTAGESWHLHFTDRIFGSSPAEAAARVARWAEQGPVSVTLHDVPQPWSDASRKRCYRDVAAHASGWAVSSHHEARLLGPEVGGGHVVHLPLLVPAPVPVPDAVAPTAGARVATPADPITLGVLGWIYPDKGHREVVAAAARLVRSGRPTTVDCLGAVAPGHEDLAAELHDRARRGGVGLRVSGYLTDRDLADALRVVDVPLAAHRHLSASASINSWIAAGRRPVVTDGRYAREVAALRPDTLHLAGDADLDRTIDTLLAEPSRTWLAPGTPLGPTMDDTVRSYRAWWASLSYDGPEPTRPVVPPR